MKTPTPAGVEIDGTKLRKLRKLRGMQLRPFASRCRISLQYLSQIERGDRPNVSPPVFDRICTALGISDDAGRERMLKAERQEEAV